MNSKVWSTENITGGEIGAAGVSGMAGAIRGSSILSSGRFDEKQRNASADMAERSAQDAISKGELQVNDIRRKTKQLIGDQRAAFAAQGIDINNGSAADVQEDTHYWGAMDEMTARNNAFLESYGYKMQALNLRTQAESTRLATDFKYRMTLVEAGVDAGKTIATAGAT